MKKMFLLISILLSACTMAHSPTALIPIPIKTPVIDMPAKPYLPIYSLTVSSTPADVMKAYVASVYALNGYSDTLATILNGYR